ncbi:hypothetical protein E6C27_scaffold84G001530 [Cucumis melo var. makuwa]|uniref:Transposase n=1 Tax=Cucumis melo var. makuwa TaxID=1194695 RepID=A0A5A7TBU6_CUCMM|nr:hypothetical protein E6C27_scaffold84G001530 [Cucumis melo var. makuwa]
MGKSWMIENRMSREYDVGVESFIQFGLSHAKGYSIRCSCLKCENRLLKDVSIVRYHLYASGIDKSYKIWFWHGEDLNSETVSSKMENTADEKYEHDDLFNTVNMFQSAHDESCNRSNTFDTMFDDAKKPLYPGCKKFTKLSALVRLYILKVRYGWSNTSFSELLSIISDLLADNNEIPTSLYEAKKTLGGGSIKTQQRKTVEWLPSRCDRKVDGIMRHPADTPSWRLIDHMWPTFRSEPRNLRLEEGVRCFDAYKEEYFTLRAVLLWTINDFPAYDYGNPPQPLSGEAIYFKLKEMIFSCGNKCGKNNNEGDNNYWKRRSDFFELPYWKNLHVQHCLDVMHIEKNVCMNIVGTLLDIPRKSEDGMNNRLDLVEINIRPELAPMVRGNRSYIPATCYTLSREEKYWLCKTLSEIKVPEELDALQEGIVMTLCNLEKYFPPYFFTIMVHLVVHLVREVKLCGPVYLRWMYAFDRYMKVLKSFVRNRNQPEGCIVEAQVSLWAEFGVCDYVFLKCLSLEVIILEVCMSSMLLKFVVDHEVLLKCVVDHEVLLKCVVDHEVLLKCVVYHEVLLKCVVDHEVLLKFCHNPLE